MPAFTQLPWMVNPTPSVATRPPARPPIGTPALSNAIPGFSNLTQDATGIIGNLMGGLPSAAPAQRSAAYFGVGSGMPGSDFVRNRGYDLYGEQAEGYKQRGFDDFLKLLTGFSGTVAPTTGQQLQNEQFNADLDFRNRQAAAQNYLDNEYLALKQPRLRENSYSEYSPLGTRTKYRPLSSTLR